MNTEIPFTFETYKEWVAALKSLKFSHFQATGKRDFGEASQLTDQILLKLPPIYQAKLPTYMLARCPICQGRVTEPIDTFSLSGTGWWISEPTGFGWFGRRIKTVYEAIRPLAYNRCPEPSYRAECSHVRAMTYGVNLNGIIPDDIRPLSWVIIGSERPGVLKPFMELAGSCAVIHHLPIGRLDDATWQPRYTVYFVTYFNRDINSFQQCLAPQDWYHWKFLWPYDWMDYDLAPWLKTGKLFWLGPEAEGYPLRPGSITDFPYAHVEGLVGRWAANRERGARLLSRFNGIDLDNPSFVNSRRVEPAEAEALQQRNFRRLEAA